MAYDADAVFHEICVYPAGRQQEGDRQDIPEHDDRLSGKRFLAWSQLDLCVLGSMPWGIYGGDPLLREVFPEDSESHKLGDNVSVRECDVDFLPGGLHGGCLAFSGQDHRLGFREDPGQYSGEIPADGD